MKRIACLTMLAAILLTSMMATAGSALINMRLRHGEIQARPGHSLPHIQVPSWYPH